MCCNLNNKNFTPKYTPNRVAFFKHSYQKEKETTKQGNGARGVHVASLEIWSKVGQGVKTYFFVVALRKVSRRTSSTILHKHFGYQDFFFFLTNKSYQMVKFIINFSPNLLNFNMLVTRQSYFPSLALDCSLEFIH